jgi:hypothetical protein
MSRSRSGSAANNGRNSSAVKTSGLRRRFELHRTDERAKRESSQIVPAESLKFPEVAA